MEHTAGADDPGRGDAYTAKRRRGKAAVFCPLTEIWLSLQSFQILGFQ